jgi:hypothetical protein
VDFLSVTGGHRVDLDAFRSMLDTISNERGWRHSHAVQPTAQRWLDGTLPFDAVLLHEHVLVGPDAAPHCDHHPPTTDAIVWATSAGNSPIVFIEPGDAAETFGLPMYRRLLANALAWVTSPDAQVWAASRRFD